MSVRLFEEIKTIVIESMPASLRPPETALDAFIKGIIKEHIPLFLEVTAKLEIALAFKGDEKVIAKHAVQKASDDLRKIIKTMESYCQGENPEVYRDQFSALMVKESSYISAKADYLMDYRRYHMHIMEGKDLRDCVLAESKRIEEFDLTQILNLSAEQEVLHVAVQRYLNAARNKAKELGLIKKDEEFNITAAMNKIEGFGSEEIEKYAERLESVLVNRGNSDITR